MRQLVNQRLAKDILFHVPYCGFHLGISAAMHCTVRRNDQVSVCVCVCVCVDVCVCGCVSLCVWLCVYVCVWLCMYVCIKLHVVKIHSTLWFMYIASLRCTHCTTFFAQTKSPPTVEKDTQLYCT